MNYKELINDLQNKLNAYKFFDDERLSLLKVALDLQIINKAQIYVEQAMNQYSKMFAKYELAAIEMETMRMQIGTLLLYVNDLEKEIVKLNSSL